MKRVGGTREATLRASAVVCVYYGHTASISRLVRALAANDVDVYVVTNRKATSGEVAAWNPDCVGILERVNLGADFGAYKDGIEYVMSDERYSKVPLVLANDSVYYFQGVEPLLARLMNHKADAAGILINKEFDYHLQSMLIRFSASTVRTGTAQRFFAEYRPRFSKASTIKRGELRLSRVMMRAGHTLGAVLDPALIRDALTASPEALWLPELARGEASAQAQAGWTMDVARFQSRGHSHDFDLLTLGALIDRTNASHMVALTLVRALRAPLKLDLLSFPRGATSLAIIDALDGYVSREDVTILSEWFSGRPSYISVSGLQLSFQRRGIR
jgi:hypothetical protein